MSKYSVDFVKAIAEYLPPKKRMPIRVQFIYRLAARLRSIHDEFISLQAKLEAQAKVTIQVIIFEDYLCEIFGDGITITVQDVETDIAWIADDDDPDLGMLIDDDQDGTVLIGSNEDLEELNFIANVPLSLNADLDYMRGLINKYKTPGSQYKIIES